MARLLNRETATDVNTGSEVAGHGFDYDLFVIGGGSGGVRASRMSASYGGKVALVELPYNPISSETHGGLGGTCVLRGCVPKKILVYGSAFSHEFEDAKGFGWEIHGEIKFNWNKLIENKTKEIERLNGVYRRMLVGAGVTLFEGFGRIVDRHTVEVKEVDGQVKTFTTNHILIATGGKAVKLDIPGKELAITSDEALSLEKFPSRVAIVGAGYIAIEFAGIYSGMGAEVHLFYRKDLPLTGFDSEVRASVAKNLEARGVVCHPFTNVVKIEENHLGLKVTTDKDTEFHVDQVMFATGRKPKTANINLEAVGVELDKTGAIKVIFPLLCVALVSSSPIIHRQLVPIRQSAVFVFRVNAYSQTTVPNIWAVGDVTNRINLTPVALMEGTCFARTVFLKEPTKPDYENVAHAVFCQPPLSSVGLTEEQATSRENARNVRVYTSSFNPMKNTVSGRQEKTFMKLIVDDTSDKVLGAMMVGPDAPEIVQGLAVALKCGATKAQFDITVGIHPTAAEEFVTMRSVTRRVAPGGKPFDPAN